MEPSMTDANAPVQCIVCSRTSREVPLMALEYRDAVFRICPQHLPALIHEPGQLAHVLPDAGTFKLPRE